MYNVRKIQIAAAAVTLNGLLALVALSPQTAYAATCPGEYFCVDSGICNTQLYALAFCSARTPAGCKYVGEFCLGSGYPGCASPKNELLCEYTTA